MSYFRKKYHPPGTAPGTLAETRAPSEARYQIRLIDYTASEFTEKDLVAAADCRPYLERDSTTWIHVQGEITAPVLEELGAIFALHALALEDVLNIGQRPKLDRFDGQVFVAMALPSDYTRDGNMTQVSLFYGTQFIVSFHAGEVDPFEPVRGRLRKPAGRIRTLQADYLLYCLLDLVIDEGFPVLETLGDRIEEMESEVLEARDRQTAGKIHELKRELLLLRRMLWPQRDVINALLRDEGEWISDFTRVHLRDCYDHTVQIIELLETYRDITSGILDVYLTTISNRLNETMRVLTLIATIFIPLTFIAGLYGMNFGDNTSSPWAMPELRWYYGYPLSLLLMAAVVAGMLVYFRRKKWL